MILDTNALSDFLAKNEALANVIESAPLLALPVIVLGEYRFGLKSSSQRKRLERDLEHLLQDVAVFDIISMTASHYADIRADLKARGRPIPGNDLWIAAPARQYDLPVLTRDGHFDAVPGLKRVGW